MQDKISQYSDFILLIPFVGALITLPITLHYFDIIGQQIASLIIGGLGTLATATLAIATYRTVLQNRQSVKELKKDREKPLAEDKLRLMIVPYINELEDKIDQISDEEVIWVDRYGYNDIIRVPCNQLSPDDLSNTVVQEIEDDNPELLKKVKKHDDMAEEINNTVDDVLEELEKQVQNFTEDKSLKNDKGEPVNESKLALYILAEITDGWPPSNHEQIWAEHNKSLIDLKDKSIRQKIDQSEERYLQCCQDLRESLIKYKVSLQQKYGISEQEIAELDTESLLNK
jgi:hypothetical protein